MFSLVISADNANRPEVIAAEMAFFGNSTDHPTAIVYSSYVTNWSSIFGLIMMLPCYGTVVWCSVR